MNASHPRVVPAYPVLRSHAEKRVFEVLKGGLRPRDGIVCNYSFRDEEVDREADFFVLFADLGVVAVEVKGGNILYDGGRWWTIPRSSGMREPIAPVDQALNASYKARRMAADAARHFGWAKADEKFPHFWAIVFPAQRHLGVVPDPTVNDDQIIYQDDLPQLVERLRDGLQRRSQRPPRLPNGWVGRMLDRCDGRGQCMQDLVRNVDAIAQTTDSRTSEIANVIRSARKYPFVAVNGAAGTGKTWLASHQAQEWSRPDGANLKVGLLAYNQGVASFLRERARDLPEASRPDTIGTFHRLARTILLPRGLWRPPSSSRRDVGSRQAQQHWFDVTVAELLVKASADMTHDEKFDAFVVDEAQDFHANWWPAIRGLLRGEAPRMLVLLDRNQDVYQRHAFPEEWGFNELDLDRNFRNSVAIAKGFGGLITEPPVAEGLTGVPVVFVMTDEADVLDTADEVAAALVEGRFDFEADPIVADKGRSEHAYDRGHVALLTTNHRHPVQREREREATQTSSEVEDRFWNYLWDSSDIFYATAMKFKGLERPAVVLAVDGFQNSARSREALYVGMSRARDVLIVVADEQTLRDAAGDSEVNRWLHNHHNRYVRVIRWAGD